METRKKPLSQANKIDHECVSVDALVEYLKRCGHQDVQVQREQEHDPPDFWLHVDGTKFAVEETSIVEQKTVTKRGFAGAKWEGEAQDALARLTRISHRTCQPSEGKRQTTSGIGRRERPEGEKQSVNATKARMPRSFAIFCLLGQAS
jgi:hypothetical protein